MDRIAVAEDDGIILVETPSGNAEVDLYAIDMAVTAALAALPPGRPSGEAFRDAVVTACAERGVPGAERWSVHACLKFMGQITDAVERLKKKGGMGDGEPSRESPTSTASTPPL